MNVITIGVLLIIYGLAALFSVSIHESFTLTLNNGDPSNYFYFFRQLRNIVVWGIVAFVVYKTLLVKIRSWRYFILWWVLLMTLLLLSPLGIELNGARLWLEVPLLWTVQPWEFFKLGFVLLICDWLVRKKRILQWRQWSLSFIMVTGLCCAIFLVLRDNGTIFILWLTALILYWYLWWKKRFLLIMIACGIVWAVVIISQVWYVKKRFDAFLNPNADTSGRGITYQVRNALTSIWAWWVWWKWYGRWLQKFWYIPEAQSDYIFAAFSEEVGFVGDLLLISWYIWLAWYTLSRIGSIRDDYLRWVGVWLLCLIILQACINIAVNTNSMPSTWLTLPFVSFGGTAIMVNMIELVLLHKILTEGKELKRLY